MSEPTPEQHLTRLRESIRSLGSVLVCYSGGLDSALVLAVAHAELGSKAVGMTAVSPSLPASEKEDAARIANRIGADHRFVDSNEIERPGYVANGPDRCFHCKTELYDIARAKAAEWGLATIANGTNTDDLGDYRPGLEAAKNAGVRSPLLEARLSKSDARAVAKLIGLPIWDKPASACLSSRIPYGTSVTHDKVARIEVALDEISRLLAPGVREAVVDAGKRHGFTYVTLDLAGYRTGSHNEVLIGRSLKVV
jgi:uncharacterized protein